MHSARSRTSRDKLGDENELEEFFTNIDSRINSTDTSSRDSSSGVSPAQTDIKRYFGAISDQIQSADVKQRRLDKRQATGFNVFALIEPDENKLSDIIASLLDPKSNHGQGDLFLRLLFKELSIESFIGATNEAPVQREAPTHGILKYRRRIDVFVEAGALLAIENKVDALEQLDQVKDYLDHLRYCTRHNRKQTTLIYLTPNGRRPETLDDTQFIKAQQCGELHCWSYQANLCDWLKACRHQCAAGKIRHFLSGLYCLYQIKP